MSELQLAQIDTELLIKEIKVRPSLYARDAPKYGDALFKKGLWEDVTCALFPKVWRKLTLEERTEKVDLVQRRWKNLRACFSRELKRQKDPKWVYGVAYKRRRYLYFKELLFLKSEFDSTEYTLNDIDLPEDTGADNTKLTIDTNIEELPIPEAMPIVVPQAKPQQDDGTSTNPIKAVPSNTETTTVKEQDSTNFALSLVPMLNMLPIDKRLDAQIALLKILRSFFHNENEENKKNNNEDSIVTLIEIKSEDNSDDDNKDDLK